VIDRQRDIDRVLAVVEERGLRVTDVFETHVFETHVHNDYVSGGLQLALATDAAYHVSGDEQVEFERSPIAGGDDVKVGTFAIRALSTPGHTPTDLSYVASDGGRDVAVFMGGSMLFGRWGGRI